ncbi:kinase binding protein CGI-121-domain-containing protein [Phlyctochytrium arcticum]|nr:kinase binding protein CGI-121-domain-containing protein [Phlyctochytrium arcticum]
MSLSMESIPLPALFAPPPADSPHSSVALPPPLPAIHCALFTNVNNSADIKQKVIKGDPSVPICAMLNAQKIIDIFQIQMACLRAVQNERQGTMKARTLYAEVLFSLSPTVNINDALRQFGIADNATSLLVVLVQDDAPDAETLNELSALIAGDATPIERLPELSDLPAIRKTYKLSNTVSDREEMLALIIGAMAIKGNL